MPEEIIFEPIEKKLIPYEEIDFDSLSLLTVKKDRQVFYSEGQELYYKIFSDGWEFADKVEEGIDSGYYDRIFIPNWYGIIKNKRGMNKGYVTRGFDEHRIIGSYLRRMPLMQKMKALLNGEQTIGRMFFPKFKPSIRNLVNLLHLHFSRALKTRALYCELNAVHVWVDDGGYHIYDLDSLRKFDWLFSTDMDDEEYIRKLVNRKIFNRGLRELILLHQLEFPFEINRPEMIEPFWKSFLKLNSISEAKNVL